MKKIATILTASLLVALTWLWPSSDAAARTGELQGPVMKAHFIDMGQAYATRLEFLYGAISEPAAEHYDGRLKRNDQGGR